MKSVDPHRPREPLRKQPKKRAIHHIEHLLSMAETPQDQLSSIRHIASEIQVSAPTVYAALKHLARQGKVRMEAGVGFFPPLPASPDPLKVAITTTGDLPHLHGYWLERVTWGILQAGAKMADLITIRPVHSEEQHVYTQELIENVDRLDGVVLTPEVFGFQKIQQAYESRGKSVVSVNPPTRCTTSNFVSPDYFEIGRKAAMAWRKTGRHRILFLSTGLCISISTGHILSGLVSGLDDTLGSSIELITRIIPQQINIPFDPNANRQLDETTFLFMKEAKPDAVFCTGDRIALSVYRSCLKQNLSVPETVSIIGASGLNLTDSIQPGLTRAQQPFQKIGEKIVQMILFRLQNNNLPVPGEFLPTPFIGLQTTREQENRILQGDK